MRTRGNGHLSLVTGQSEAVAVAAPPSPAVPAPCSHAGRIIATTTGLGLVLGLLGSQHWSLPSRTGSAVSDVPHSLVGLLLLCAGVCLWVAGRVTAPEEAFRSPTTARLWWVCAVGTAVVSVAACLSLASYGGAGLRPADLLVRWLVPVVPAVLGGVLARHDRRAARIRSALGTGVVSLPLFALGWALFASPAGVPLESADVVSMVLLVGATPFALAVAFVAAERRRR